VLPVELMELSRADGVPRTVLCFLDEDGYLANVECVYYDDVMPEWPEPHNCAVGLRDGQGYLEAVELPSGVIVRPHQLGDRWVSFETQGKDGFCAATWNGYRECYAADGTALPRVFTK
jgi:hypothetical protein